jgi:DNA-binding response OmpR family regulator
MNGKAMRVMVFEDDFLLAGTLTDVLTRLGCEVGTCVGSFEEAMEAATTGTCDLVVVDLELRGVMAYPILERLEARGIPFILATSTARHDIPRCYDDVPSVSKPYDIGELRVAIASTGNGRGSSATNIRRSSDRMEAD